MLDISVFRDTPDRIRADHDRRGLPHDAIDAVLDLDARWRASRRDADTVRAERNRAARAIGAAKKAGDATEAERLIAENAALGARIDELAAEADALLTERDALRMRIPNLLHPDVPTGADDQANTLHSLRGERAELAFAPQTHNDLIDANHWVDLSRAAAISGSRFFFLKGDLARLELALQAYAIDLLTERGYTLVQPPVMMNREAYEGVTDLSDFETVMYRVEPDGFYLIATSEHPLTAMYMGEVVEPSALPIKLVGVSPCFRREVGAHGQSDKGIWRVHQFSKVEQIIISHPDASWDHHEELLDNAIELWDALGLHYRVVNICTGDMGTVAARKYDLEAWLPGVGEYKEVVSCSNCTDYQANRLKLRYRTPEGNATVHTLNSTAVATTRALVAILEQYQRADGSVAVPEVLQSYMGGRTVLRPGPSGVVAS